MAVHVQGEAIWIEMVHGASGYRWYIKPEANRGSSSVCFAYCKFDEFNPTLPFDREKDKWLVYDGKEFKTQDTVVSKVEPPDVPVPEHHWELLEMVKNDLTLKHQKRKEKVLKHCTFCCYNNALLFCVVGSSSQARISNSFWRNRFPCSPREWYF